MQLKAPGKLGVSLIPNDINMISNLVIINMRGDVLIYRDYKNDIRRGEVINFTSHLLSAKGLNQDPIIYFKVMEKAV